MHTAVRRMRSLCELLVLRDDNESNAHEAGETYDFVQFRFGGIENVKGGRVVLKEVVEEIAGAFDTLGFVIDRPWTASFGLPHRG